MKSGIIVIKKEQGYTSFDVVAKLRGILKIKKIGHTGTLDPQATGVLPICIGKATKVCDLLTNRDKTYETIMKLGVTTDTQDIYGNIIAKSLELPSEEQIKNVIQQFQGELEQVPPMYSALKVNGKKLCDLARKGIEVERKPRQIVVYKINIKSIELPFVTMEISCSKGTYIRTLCHDIGQVLGCGACMKALNRTSAAGYTLEDAFSLEEIQQLFISQELEDKIQPIDEVFREYPKVTVSSEIVFSMKNGGKTSLDKVICEDCQRIKEGDYLRLYLPDTRFLGIYQFRRNEIKLVKMFLEE